MKNRSISLEFDNKAVMIMTEAVLSGCVKNECKRSCEDAAYYLKNKHKRLDEKRTDGMQFL